MPLPRGPRRTPSPAAVDVEVLIAGGILAAAGWLQWSVSSGEQGINAFLMKEKQDNPFYNGKYKPEGTTAEPGGGGPSWLRRLRLPSLPYVEVYGEAAGQAGRRGAAPPRGGSSRSRLYAELDAAIDREDYAAAKLLKERIDDFRAKLPLISCICNKGMRDRHWKEVSGIIGCTPPQSLEPRSLPPPC